MPMIKVRERFQVTIPPAICQAADLAVGDDVEVALEGKLIVLKPQASPKDAAMRQPLPQGYAIIK